MLLVAAPLFERKVADRLVSQGLLFAPGLQSQTVEACAFPAVASKRANRMAAGSSSRSVARPCLTTSRVAHLERHAGYSRGTRRKGRDAPLQVRSLQGPFFRGRPGGAGP